MNDAHNEQNENETFLPIWSGVEDKPEGDDLGMAHAVLMLAAVIILLLVIACAPALVIAFWRWVL